MALSEAAVMCKGQVPDRHHAVDKGRQFLFVSRDQLLFIS